MAKGVFGEAKERLNRIVRNGLLLEESPQVIMRSMAKVLRDKTEPELLRIYRTEFSHALNLGTQARGQAAVDDGAELYKYWLATKDSRTRDSHRAVDAATNPDSGGEPIKFSEDYNVGGHSASGPHDASLPPEEVINCRCRSILIPKNVL
jgi:Phage Mu protein F like protein.